MLYEKFKFKGYPNVLKSEEPSSCVLVAKSQLVSDPTCIGEEL